MDEELRRSLRVVREVQAAIHSLSQSTVAATVSQKHAPVTIADGAEPPTAFVSWAHTLATWSPEQASDWESQVAAFAALLRRLGIRADVDLFHLDETQDWTRYGPRQVQTAKYTLIVMSRAWAERWSGTNSAREGAGAAAEADTLKGLFARDQDAWQRRVVIVMFPEVNSEVVPPDLQRVARVSVDPANPDSFEQLIRMLTGQPRYPTPPLGRVPVLPTAGTYGESEALVTLRERLDNIEKRRHELSASGAQATNAERERLDLSEAATRGFIDAELTIED